MDGENMISPADALDEPLSRYDLLQIVRVSLDRYEKVCPMDEFTTTHIDRAIAALEDLRSIDSQLPQHKKPRRLYLKKTRPNKGKLQRVFLSWT